MKMISIVANTEQRILRINIFKVLYLSVKSLETFILENKLPYGSEYRMKYVCAFHWR